MDRPLTCDEWKRLVEGEEAFSIILPFKRKQARVIILLDNGKEVWMADDLDEAIATWRELSPYK